MKKMQWIIITIIFLLFLTGCGSIGPRTICLDRNRYSNVIRDTNHSQLLTNIVHIRYSEPSFFMKLSNVTASFAFEANINDGQGGFAFLGVTQQTGTDPFVQRTAQINPGVLYADRPTISYIPLDDAEFATQLMQPLSLEKLQLLFAGGIDEPGTLMRLTIQSINEIDNASSASSSKIARLPCYKEYYRFLGLLLKLYREGTCGLEQEVDSEGLYTFGIHFNECCVYSPAAMEIKRMLQVSPTARDIVFTEDMHRVVPNTAFIRTRSILGMMTFLSFGVEVPECDIKAHRVYEFTYPDGRPFDWAPLMAGLIKIYSSDAMPCDAFVKTHVHGHWFYIKNSDLDSKATFTLLARLTTLAAGVGPRGIQGPILTIPANAG